MSINKAAVMVAIAGVMAIAGAQTASAASIAVACTSPGINVNPPNVLTQLPDSVCDQLAPLPVGAVVNAITLQSRYSISLEIGSGNTGSAFFGHVANVGTTAFNNGAGTAPTSVTNPPAFTDMMWGPIACPSAACNAVLATLLGGTSTVSSWVNTPTGASSAVSTDFAWIIDYTPRQVPEPTSMVLLGMGMLGAGIARRRRQ